MSSQPPPPPDDAWPTGEGQTAVRTTEDTAVQPAPAGPPPDEPDRRIGWGLLLGILVVALAAGAIAAVWLLTRDDDATTTTVVTTTPASTAAAKVAVPHLIGLKESQALVRLGEVGLRPKEVFQPTQKPTKVVVSQKPPDGTEVEKGSQVTLVIDSGAPTVAVPDVVGQPVDAATAKLDALGLDTRRTEVTSTEPANTVVDQAPAAGAKAAKGSVVTLSVSKGAAATTGTTTAASTTPAPPKTVTVPEVTGGQLQPAAARLGTVQLLASAAYIPGTDPLGTVEAMSPKGGQTAKQRSHVTLNVSSGPGQKTQRTVPDAVGQTLDEAVARIRSAGLRTIFLKVPVTDRAQAGKVVEETPAAGQTAPENAQVLIYLGAFRS